MRYITIIFFSIVIYTSCSAPAAEDEAEVADADDEFSFIFMTDLHTQSEWGAAEGVSIAIDTANQLGADFVLTGGDLVYDVMRGNFNRSDSLFQLYQNTVKKLNVPVYHCIGNHELFGIYEESDVDSTHADYKYGMFERYFGKTYYSFDHKGWHFMVLNSLDVKNMRYYGVIGEEQQEWIRQDLAQVDPETPIAIAMHIPLVSVFSQIYDEPMKMKHNHAGVQNRDEVLELFEGHNLRLALQGHKHWLEDINVMGKTRFITGGAIAGRPSWGGTRTGEEGFLKIKVKGQDISWDYIDYGWETQNPRD